MDDTISRQAAIDAVEFGITYAKAINKETGEVKNLFEESNAELKEAVGRIKQLPSAYPKRGKWLPDNNNYIYEQYVCSECKNSFKVDTCMGKPMWNFCPNCGAKMEETT